MLFNCCATVILGRIAYCTSRFWTFCCRLTCAGLETCRSRGATASASRGARLRRPCTRASRDSILRTKKDLGSQMATTIRNLFAGPVRSGQSRLQSQTGQNRVDLSTGANTNFTESHQRVRNQHVVAGPGRIGSSQGGKSQTCRDKLDLSNGPRLN